MPLKGSDFYVPPVLISQQIEAKEMKLRENGWWPKSWRAKNHQDIPPEQISKDGILERCELTAQGLVIEVDYYGGEVLGRVPQPSVNSPGNLAGLRDFLLEHTGSRWRQSKT